MSDAALQRTVRRGVALLLLPLSLLVIQFDLHLRARANLVDSWLVNTSELAAAVLLVAAALYLLAIVAAGLYAARG